MGRATNGKATAMNGNKISSSLRVSRPNTVKGPPIPKGDSTSGKATADKSQLNFPYDIRLSGFTSIQNAVTRGTPKIRRILTEECDYIMECRVCRNLFRSLPNFITHKLNYCKKAFDSTWCIGLSNLVQNSDRQFNIEYEVDPELLIDEKAVSNSDDKTRSVSDLYDELVTKVQAQRSTAAFKQTVSADDDVVRLRIKPLVDSSSGSIVLQQHISNDPTNCDVSSSVCQPIDTVPRDTAILGPDGKVLCTGTGKGIEEVVSRLSAQMLALEARRVSANSPKITCNTCKTVFDSEKSLRQHKREGLDCGKTWGSKSPLKPNQPNVIKASDDKLIIPAKRFKTHNEVPSDSSSQCRVTKEFTGVLRTPFQSRRHSQKALQSPIKLKRGLSLSPVKKIKMKYSKLDSTGNNMTDDRPRNECKSLSCNSCSSSFSTKHEMSMHLALCNGVINYAFLKDVESPKEKIRISARNEFGKSANPSVCRTLSMEEKSKIEKTNNIQLHLDESEVPSNSLSQSHLNMLKQARKTKAENSVYQASPEVNNNRQYKDDNCRDKSIENVDQSVSSSRIKHSNDVTMENDTSYNDNDISSESSNRNTKEIADSATTDSKIPKSVSSSVKSRKSKPSKINVVAQVITRFEKKHVKPEREFNLRRTVTPRIRKSGRIPGSTLFRQK